MILGSVIKMHASALVYATLILAIVASCFLAASSVVSTIPVGQVPVQLQGAVSFLQMVFNVPVVAFVVLFVRGLYGYYASSLSELAKNNAAVTYNLSRYGKTVAVYLMVATAASATLPAPWNSVAIAVTFFADVAYSEFKRIVS
jgi:ABC-type glycerol-3-phosphate transport system permease component